MSIFLDFNEVKNLTSKESETFFETHQKTIMSIFSQYVTILEAIQTDPSELEQLASVQTIFFLLFGEKEDNLEELNKEEILNSKEEFTTLLGETDGFIGYLFHLILIRSTLFSLERQKLIKKTIKNNTEYFEANKNDTDLLEE